jgi:hypothetical protein
MSPNPKPCLTRNDKGMRVEKKWERERENDHKLSFLPSKYERNPPLNSKLDAIRYAIRASLSTLSDFKTRRRTTLSNLQFFRLHFCTYIYKSIVKLCFLS